MICATPLYMLTTSLPACPQAMMANTYRQWRTEPRAPSVSGAPGACGRMAANTPSSSPSAAPAAAAVRSCGQVEPGHEQEQLAAEALAGFRVESVCRV